MYKRQGYNRVYGYYIDVPKTFTGELPEDYVRKQTLVANERYFTAELKQLETELTTAQERVCQLEYKYFCDLRDSCLLYTSRRLPVPIKLL